MKSHKNLSTIEHMDAVTLTWKIPMHMIAKDFMFFPSVCSSECEESFVPSVVT